MTNEDVFYDMKSVPFSDRESFNNTILLLTMVKSKYYYIIGFSRPEEYVWIGFDFESRTEGVFTRELKVAFGDSATDIILSCEVGIPPPKPDIIAKTLQGFQHFRMEDGMIRYEQRIAKSTLFPSTVQMMNRYLLSARTEIEQLLKQLNGI